MKAWQGAAFNEVMGTPMLTVVAHGHGDAYVTIQQPTQLGVSVARFCAHRELLLEIADALRAAAEVA